MFQEIRLSVFLGVSKKLILDQAFLIFKKLLLFFGKNQAK